MNPGRKHIIFIIVLLLSIGSFSLSAQAVSNGKLMNLQAGDDLFEAEDYVGALKEYLKVEQTFPTDLILKRKIGVCYLKMHDDRSKAIPYLAAVFNENNGDRELMIQLGQAHQYANKLTDAIYFYEMFRKTTKKKEELEIVDHYIECMETAKELMKHPVPVIFENLGKEINGKGADYYPFVTKDESTMYFTSRRVECTGSEKSVSGYFASDIFVSKVRGGQWSKAKNLGPLFNSPGDEECVGVTPDGKNMVIFINRLDVGAGLLHAEYKEKTKALAKPEPFNEPVNSEHGEYEGCFTPDANTLFFVSDRKGGAGQEDIFVTHKLPNGEWGIPQNLGDVINTKYNESFPFIAEDGKTLYFASEGHTNMGGFDIFKSVYDSISKKWSNPVNMGYPINTTSDDMMFSVAGRGRDGFLSAWRKEGYGDLDIYKIIFTQVEKPLTAVHGSIKSIDTTKKELEGEIIITDLKNKKEVERKNVNPETGKYVFVVEPGKYRIDVKCKQHADFTQEITINDKSEYTSEVEKNFTLTSSNYVPPKKVTPKKK